MALFSTEPTPKLFMEFIPNQGFLVMVDSNNKLEVIDLSTAHLRVVFEKKLPERASCLYVPQFVEDSEDAIFAYLGFVDGSVRVFSLYEGCLLDFVFFADTFLGKQYRSLEEPVSSI